MAGSEDIYQVVIVKYGTRSATRSGVYLNYPLYHEADGPIEMDYFFWVLRNSQRTVVVDTGFSREGGATRQRTSLIDVPVLFDSLGVDPTSKPDVILTHAHYDHAGNLDYFPGSRIYTARLEFEFWMGRHSHRTLFHHSVEDRELGILRQINDEGRLELFEGTLSLAPGIELIELGGHTPGQCVVKVQTSDGPALLASDAMHYYEEYNADMLFTSVANLVEMYEGFDRIREMERAGEVAHLVSGHDPDTLNRFTRMNGPYGHLMATIGAFAEDAET